MPVIPALEKLRQEDHKFKGGPGDSGRLCLRLKKEEEEKKEKRRRKRGRRREERRKRQTTTV